MLYLMEIKEIKGNPFGYNATHFKKTPELLCVRGGIGFSSQFLLTSKYLPAH